MKYFWKSARTLLFLGIVIFSLTLNVALLVGGSIYAAASSAIEAATGLRTVASRHAAEVAELTDDLNAERRAKRKLAGEVADLSASLVNERRLTGELRREVTEVSGKLVSEQKAARQLRREAADLADELLLVRGRLNDEMKDLVIYRGRKVEVSEAVQDTANLISDRSRKSATRGLGAMAGESLPLLGTAVIVGVTALELKDLCDTITDMNHLKRAVDPSLEPADGAHTVCSMEVPSREALLSTAMASPRQAWAQATAFVPSIEDLRRAEDFEIDWDGYQDSVQKVLSDTSGIIVSAFGSAVDTTTAKAKGLYEWWTAEEPEMLESDDGRQ